MVAVLIIARECVTSPFFAVQLPDGDIVISNYSLFSLCLYPGEDMVPK